MIGCDWLNTPEELWLQSADDGLCVSTVDYRVSLWFHLFHIHEPNGRCCIIHEQIRRSKTPAWTRRCAGCRAMQKKKNNEVNTLKSGQVLFLFTQLNCLYVNDPSVEMRRFIDFCEFWCPESNRGLSEAELKRNPVLFQQEKGIYPVYRTRGWEPSACKRAALFCFPDQLAYQQSGQSKRSVSNQAEPCF